MAKGKSGGRDWWIADELATLPENTVKRLFEFCSTVEQTGVWPDVLMEGFISLLLKEDGSSKWSAVAYHSFFLSQYGLTKSLNPPPVLVSSGGMNAQSGVPCQHVTATTLL